MGDPAVESAASVSVVIPTYNRCEDCKRAALSALEQEPAPLEVLVCDDGSTDDTQAEFERWQAVEPRLRYLRLSHNRGIPAPARNVGAAAARGAWVALLDDDDRWLPGKLACQAPLLGGEVDVVATDAIRSSGERYFGPAAGSVSPTRKELERANPIIVSSALVRRSLLLEVKGFYESPAIAGVEDYDLWLRLADRGARFTLIDAATIEYHDHGEDRFSNARLKMQRATLRLRLRRLRLAPLDGLVLRSALRECAITASMSAMALLGR